MLRGKDCVRPHGVIVIHWLTCLLTSRRLVLEEAKEVVDVLAWLLALEHSVADVLRRC